MTRQSWVGCASVVLAVDPSWFTPEKTAPLSSFTSPRETAVRPYYQDDFATIYHGDLRGELEKRDMRRQKPPKRSNPKRKKAEFARCYHSKQRVGFVASLPCAACGRVSKYWGHARSENAHIENGGMGRKADYTKIVPLCGPHENDIGYDIGCHGWLHQWGRERFEKFCGINLENAAIQTEAAWLSFSGGSPTEGK